MQNTAVILVGRYNDFVTGALACERARRIIVPADEEAFLSGLSCLKYAYGAECTTADEFVAGV
jgi:hypothetical protein